MVLIFLSAICLAGFILYLVYFLYEKKYFEFVEEHSKLIKQIKEVNSRYKFNNVNDLYFKHRYDNEKFYNSISPLDYLIYELNYKKEEVENILRSVVENNNKYDYYKYDVNQIVENDEYDIEVTLKNRKKLQRIEEKLKDQYLYKHKLDFRIYVYLHLTNINDVLKCSKSDTFDIEKIEDILLKLKDKKNGRFNNEEVWNSISRVERGKVSNKMRFAIYERDGYRCRMCGRKNKDLEVDHIMPISKGGKTTFDNLQTLCHKCNTEKNDTIIGGTIGHIQSRNGFCPKCGAPLKLKVGKYGKFYGCLNYPKCNYTKQL